MSNYKSSKLPLLILKKGQALDTASSKKSVTSLLGSHDGTEVIHHCLEKGGRWGMSPEDELSGPLESVYVLAGKLKLHGTNTEVFFEPGDFLAGQPVRDFLVLTALEDSEFLYITSKPTFHYYSNDTRNLEMLAVEIEKKDGYTADHCSRIKDLSMLVGEKIGMNSESLQKLHFGALLHDIGKTEVPESILLKPGKLNEDEWVIMKDHTKFGADILRKTNITHFILAAEVVEQHHERYDGSGYPEGLKEDQICVEAAIVGLVDSYDAMTSERIYSKARSKESALTEIKQLRGIKYNPEIVDYFLSIVESN